MASTLNDPKLEALLERLHATSDAHAAETDAYFRARTGPWRGMEPRDHEHFADKLVALDREKCELCYALCRATRTRRIVEVGTSFGVSTLYLAAAVRDNGGGLVTGSEYEPGKVQGARANFAAAGLSDYVDLREGDLRETFRSIDGPIDFVLFDIWAQLARPALDLLLPQLRAGSIICTDNTSGERSRQSYAQYFEIIEDPAHGFRTTTLPLKGGFDISVKG